MLVSLSTDFSIEYAVFNTFFCGVVSNSFLLTRSLLRQNNHECFLITWSSCGGLIRRTCSSKQLLRFMNELVINEGVVYGMDSFQSIPKTFVLLFIFLGVYLSFHQILSICHAFLVGALNGRLKYVAKFVFCSFFNPQNILCMYSLSTCCLLTWF